MRSFSQQHLYAIDASLLASQVMRASETDDNVVELDDERASQLLQAIRRVDEPSDALVNLRKLVS